MLRPSVPNWNVFGITPGAGNANAQVLNQLCGMRNCVGQPEALVVSKGALTRSGRAGFPNAAPAEVDAPARTTVNGEPDCAVIMPPACQFPKSRVGPPFHSLCRGRS